MRMAPERGSPSAPVRWFWRLTYVLASIACGLASRAVSAQCRIVVEQAHLKGVMVSALGVSFALDIDGVPLTREPETGKANASVQVMAPLRFAASYPMDKLAFRIKERVDLYGGRIRLGKKAASAWLGIRGDDMQLSLHSTLGIDVKQPLQIPCSHVGLSDGTPYSTPDVVWPSKDLDRSERAPPSFPCILVPKKSSHCTFSTVGPSESCASSPDGCCLRQHGQMDQR